MGKAISGVLFDFNGTLFYDGVYHEMAFEAFAQKHLGRALKKNENMDCIQGHINPDIMRHFFGNDITDAQIKRYADEKEALYRALCVQNRARLSLTRGAEALFELLKARGIPFAVASSCPPESMTLYFELFGLSRWFDRRTAMCFDGSLRGKPAPDMYLEAARRIGARAQDCVVFEDSDTGLEAASNAHARHIVALYESPRFRAKPQPYIMAYLRDFTGAAPLLQGVLF